MFVQQLNNSSFSYKINIKFLNYHDSYEIMMSCWRPDPSQRPSFSELVTSPQKELESIGVSGEKLHFMLCMQ